MVIAIRKRVLLGLTMAVLLAAMPAVSPRAQPVDEESEQSPIVLTLVGAMLAMDTALTIHNVVVERSSKRYGLAETILTVPQVALGIWYMTEAGVDSLIPGLLYTVWTGSLATHGIYVLLRDEGPEPGGEQPARTTSKRMILVPAVVSDGQDLGTGLGLVGRF